MNKGKNKGKIQKSRQNAEGREAGSFKVFTSSELINYAIGFPSHRFSPSFST